MLGEVFGTSFDEGSEISQVVQRLAGRRNTLVHPRPELEAWRDDGTITVATAKRLPRTDTRSAEAAVQDMERFFELFKSIDGHAAVLLGLV